VTTSGAVIRYPSRLCAKLVKLLEGFLERVRSTDYLRVFRLCEAALIESPETVIRLDDIPLYVGGGAGAAASLIGEWSLPVDVLILVFLELDAGLVTRPAHVAKLFVANTAIVTSTGRRQTECVPNVDAVWVGCDALFVLVVVHSYP